MTDIEKFIEERKARNPQAWAGFDEEYQRYAIGLLLAEHRERAGVTLTELAARLDVRKAALSRLENHGEDVRLSTISRYVEATGLPLALMIMPSRDKPANGRKIGARILLESGSLHV
jgi:transcriptional regulator with XRE-family HTH domain